MTAMKESAKRMNNGNASGFTIAQLVITLAVISVVSSFALLGIRSARASIRLSGATRELAGYLEKARGDAVRRHGTTSITIAGDNSYTVTMDFGVNGITQTRTFALPAGVTFNSIAAGTSISFDWRGRVSNEVGIGLINENEDTSRINISGSGDVTLDNEAFLDSSIPNVNLNTNVNANVATGPAPNSNGSGNPSPTPWRRSTPSSRPTRSYRIW